MQTETRTWLSAARHWLEALAWGVFFACALAFLGARYWLLPNIERYREDIVGAVSRSVGLKVSAGRIEAAWHGLRPQLLFTDVRVFDRDGREALVLPAVEGVLGWRSLVVGGLALHSLAIDGPRLTLRRDAAGAVYVAGMKLADEGGEGRLTDWILAQHEIGIRNAEVEWLDEQRGAPPLTLGALNFRLRNDGGRHAIGLSARPPGELGSLLELRAELIGRSVTEPAAWNGRVYAELGYTDLAGWRAWVDYPVDVRKGQGALRLWSTLSQGRITRATADVALTGAAARLAADLPLLEVDSVHGRLHGRETPRGYEFGVRNLALDAARAPAMQSTSFRATWQRGEANRPQRGTVNADQIELAPLAHLADFLPFPADLRKLLLEISPQGNLFDVRFDWTGELPEAAFHARTRFAGLAMNAWRTIPGFSGLSGQLDATEARGTLQLSSSQAELDLPKVFPEPRIGLQSLNGEAQWEWRDAATLNVRIPGVSFANADLAGTAFGSYQHAGAGPGVIDLSAQLARADGRRTARYLPLASILGEQTRKWLASSILAGQASDVRFRLRGDLREFPFIDAAKGQFQVAAQVKGGVLDYADGWPRVEAIDGELLFERDRMEIVARSGRILGARIANVRASIPSLLAEPALLTINGQAEGPTAEFLGYIQRSPVRGMIDGLTDGMRADGSGRLQLRLDLPLDDLAATRVAGEYRLAGNQVVVDPRLPPVERASGRVSFTESSLALNEVRGQLFGGPVAISGGSGPGGVTVVARGEATVRGLRDLVDHPWRAQLSGGAPYTATVAVRDARTQITFETALQGVASSLPPPLAKHAGETLPLRVEVHPAADGDRIALAVGSVAVAEFHRQKQGNAMALARAGLLFHPAPGAVPRVPERRGITIHGALPAFDFDRWRPLLAAGGDAGIPASFEVRVGTLDVLGRRLGGVAVRGASDAAGWAASVSATELAGEFTYRAAGRGTLVARLKHFTIPAASPGAAAPAPGTSVFAEGATDSDLPAVDFVADSFAHGEVRLGRVEVQAQHEGANWRIERIAIVNPEGSLSGTGLWRTGRASRTALDLRLESSDVGKLLERLGHPGCIAGGKGTLEGRLEWDGEPAQPQFPSLAGQLSLQAESGQFPQINAGFGRVLSLVSLNLSEATAKGYAFDTITGAFTLKGGVAHTEDLKIRSSAAEVTMKGDVDLGRETQDLQARVVPTVRRGVTTLATIINPAVAIGVAVGQAVLKDPFGQIFSAEYKVTGSWSDPKVERTDVAPPPVVSPGDPVPGN